MQATDIRLAMATFPYRVNAVTNSEGEPVLAFSHEGMEIHDVTVTSCGRFKASPADYGLTIEQAEAFNLLQLSLASAAQHTLDELSKSVQDHLAVPSGDFAGVYFSGEASSLVRKLVVEYAAAEISEISGAAQVLEHGTRIQDAVTGVFPAHFGDGVVCRDASELEQYLSGSVPAPLGDDDPGQQSRAISSFLAVLHAQFEEGMFTSGHCAELAVALFEACEAQGKLWACIRSEHDIEGGALFSTTFSHMAYEDKHGRVWDIDGVAADERWGADWHDDPDDAVESRFAWEEVRYADVSSWLVTHFAELDLDLVAQLKAIAANITTEAELVDETETSGNMDSFGMSGQ